MIHIDATSPNVKSRAEHFLRYGEAAAAIEASVPDNTRDLEPGNVVDIFPRIQAARFLQALDPAGRFTFQTFDDNANRKDKSLARIMHGSFEDCRERMEQLNRKGAGVFVTINETDGKGRKAENIVRVRARFADLDGAPLEPVLADNPDIVNESSPGRFHAYWLGEVPLAAFKGEQLAIIKKYSSDTAVCDLPRVMRLPGFVHQKGEPFVSRIVSIADRAPTTHFDYYGQHCEEYRGQRVDWKALLAGACDDNVHAPIYRSNASLISGDGMTPEDAIETIKEELKENPFCAGWDFNGNNPHWDALLADGKQWAKNIERQEQKERDEAQPLPMEQHGEANAEPVKSIIRNRLPENGTGLFTGQWGTFKTYAMLDMAAHIVTGFDWTGEPVYKQGGVLIFVPEGANSIAPRLQALIKYKLSKNTFSEHGEPAFDPAYPPKEVNIERLPIKWVRECPPLLGKKNPLPVLIATAKAAHECFMREHDLPLVLILIDTLSSAADFTDEDKAAEAARAIGKMRDLGKATGTLVMAVDHLGKTVEAGTRGSSAKEGNVDVILGMLGTKQINGGVVNTRMTVRKLKDGAQGIEIPFTARVVEGEPDERGYATTQRVIDWNVKDAGQGRPEVKLSDGVQRLCMAFDNLMTSKEKQHWVSKRFYGADRKVLRYDDVRDEYISIYPEGVGTEEQRLKAAQRAYERAVKMAAKINVAGDTPNDTKKLPLFGLRKEGKLQYIFRGQANDKSE
jgi:hypothetical protein